MTRQELVSITKFHVRKARSWCAREITTRRVIAAVVGGGAIVLVAATVEALSRAWLPNATSRLVTALYTRPRSFDGEGSTPIPISTVNGGPIEYRIPLPIGDFPKHLIDAVLAIEDQRFYDHSGIDFRRIAGALAANVKAAGIAQGGSTITQQLAKNLFLSARRTPIRKLREAAMALVLEARYQKEEILEAYLNEIYLGQDRGAAIHGIGAASRYYFGKDARRLLLSEAATLAAMISAPNRLSPLRQPAELRSRRNLVLNLMVEQERISQGSRDQSARVAVPGRVHPRPTIEGRWFRDFIADAVPKGLPKRGGAVYTSLDARLQRAAEEAVRNGMRALGNRGTQAALVAIDPRTGEILAMVGGREYGASQFNRAVQARRQPGSAFKPIVALTALEPSGHEPPAYTLASSVPDLPLSVRSGPDLWQPTNFDGEFRGEVTLRQALEESLNVPFARIGLALGSERITAMAHRLGISSPLNPVPSLALGASEVSLLELTRAYGVLASGGRLAATLPITSVVKNPGAQPEFSSSAVAEVLDPGVAWLVTSALQGVVEHGTGQGLRRKGIAGKTGTSNDFRDAWFIAYTPELVVGAWVGNDDGRSLRQTGAAVAVPLVAQFISRAGVQGSDFEIPDGVVRSYTGSGGWMSTCGDSEYFLRGTEPPSRFCWPIDLSGIRNWFDRDRITDRDELRDALREVERELNRQARELERRARRWDGGQQP